MTYLCTGSKKIRGLLKKGLLNDGYTPEMANKAIHELTQEWRVKVIFSHAFVSALFFLARRAVGGDTAIGPWLSIAGALFLMWGMAVAMRLYSVGENDQEDNEEQTPQATSSKKDGS